MVMSGVYWPGGLSNFETVTGGTEPGGLSNFETVNGGTGPVLC